jgi:hypothetical protein
MSLKPLHEGMPEVLECKTSTEYCRVSLGYYKRIVSFGEALVDLEKASKGINPKNPVEFYSWKAFECWFKEAKKSCTTIADIKRFINNEYSKDQKEMPITFDQTSLNHIVNRYTFLGLLYKLKEEKNDIYYFEKMIRKKGINWFRIDNWYMHTDFQKEKGLGLIATI